jgi:hypothetical protein
VVKHNIFVGAVGEVFDNADGEGRVGNYRARQSWVQRRGREAQTRAIVLAYFSHGGRVVVGECVYVKLEGVSVASTEFWRGPRAS